MRGQLVQGELLKGQLEQEVQFLQVASLKPHCPLLVVVGNSKETLWWKLFIDQQQNRTDSLPVPRLVLVVQAASQVNSCSTPVQVM